jgi:hypothetical protein
MSIISPLINAGASVTLYDYEHAHKTFSPTRSSIIPKSKNWFHIFFDLDPNINSILISQLGDAVNNNHVYWNYNSVPGLGILAKTVTLPNFKFDTKKSNQYNKWNIITTKINYEPTEISFWDDSIGWIRGLWYAYYQYMIQDPVYTDFNAIQQQGVNVPTQWSPTTGDVSSLYTESSIWANQYGMDTVSAKTLPFFRSIRIYQFSRDTTGNGVNYTEYVLVNPVITAFMNDATDSASSEFMTNRMTIEYETVLYNGGYLVNSGTEKNPSTQIASWDWIVQNFIDTVKSPLTGTNFNTNNIVKQISGAVTSDIGTVSSVGNGTTTPITFLNSAIGSAEAVATAITNPSGALNIQVPTITQGYGSSGFPSNQNGA